jgi:hypothetical protein
MENQQQIKQYQKVGASLCLGKPQCWFRKPDRRKLKSDVLFPLRTHIIIRELDTNVAWHSWLAWLFDMVVWHGRLAWSFRMVV